MPLSPLPELPRVVHLITIRPTVPLFDDFGIAFSQRCGVSRKTLVQTTALESFKTGQDGQNG